MALNVLKLKRRQLCIGDMNQRVILSDREITEPGFAETDFGEKFADPKEVWAKVETPTGRTLWNGVDTDIVLTHEVSIHYDPEVTAETWVQLLPDETRLKVEAVENLEERNEWLVLACRARGTDEASKA